MSEDIYFRHNSFRKEQDQMIKDIYNSIEHKKNILVHAPTGTGKTDAAISAALSIAHKKDLKILFLTPKISQHKIALEVIEGINKKYNLDLKAIDFVGKRNMCVDPVISQTKSSFYELCRQAIKKKQCPFYENIKPKEKSKRDLLNYKLDHNLENENTLSHLAIKNLAENYKSISGKRQPLCAYELAKKFAKKCEVIIADYYHVFSTKVANSTLAEINVDLKDCILIVDEAHNLENRLSKLASKSLNTFIVSKGIEEAKEIKAYNVKKILQLLLKKINSFEDNNLLKTKKEMLIKKEDLLFDEIEYSFFEFVSELEELSLEYIELTKKHSSALANIALFLSEWMKNKKTHIRIVKKEKNTITIKYSALDISDMTSKIFDLSYSSILMSATLTPLKMYKEILGLDNNTILKEYKSPFDKENKKNFLITDVSTKYTRRNKEEYKKIANHITKIINKVPGNSVVFSPSFQILNEVVYQVKTNKPILIQEEKQSTIDFEKMINDFKNHSKKFGSTLFAVMGGKASEGIDLPGDYLKCAVIIGIPLAIMDLEVRSKINYFKEKYNNGWLYAYIQPAIQKVIQSAGRVIRDNNDKGVIVYLDQRYLWENYRKCMPKDQKMIFSKDIEKNISDFFKN
jgi:DNA excision repair protein ERCC-2